MIDLSILPLFFIASVMLVLSPGPDLLLISTYSSSKGFKAGFMLAIGIFVSWASTNLASRLWARPTDATNATYCDGDKSHRGTLFGLVRG